MRNLLKFFALAFIASIGTASAQVSSPVGPGPASGGVTSVTGTANEITASAPTGAITLSLPAALTFTGKTVTGGTFAGPTVTGSFTATGLVTVADLVSSATTVNGQICTLGSTCTVASVATAANLAGGTAGALAYQTGAGATGFISAVATGSVLLSAGTGTVPAYGALPLTTMATQATNTVVGNATSGSAAPTALAVGSCSTAGSALKWTTNTGFGCNTSITAATNANLTGPITSSGNATAVAAQTGTGSVFAMQAAPQLTTPDIGVATATSLAIAFSTNGTASSSLTNSNAGITARVVFNFSNGTNATAFIQNGVNYTPSGAFKADGGMVYFGGAGGGTLYTPSTNPIDVYINDTDIFRWVSTGPIFVVMPADTASVDASVCRDTTSGAGKTGTGALGICLGTSSQRFKHDIKPLTIGIDAIMRLEPKSYYLNKDHGDPAQLQYGLIAEDLVKVLPVLVRFDKDGKVNNYDWSGLFPVLINGEKDLQRQIIDLRTENFRLRTANETENKLLYKMRLRLDALERSARTRQARN